MGVLQLSNREKLTRSLVADLIGGITVEALREALNAFDVQDREAILSDACARCGIEAPK